MQSPSLYKSVSAHRVPLTAWIAGSLLLASFLSALFLSGAALADTNSWPQWRGPNLDGTSEATNLPLTWDAETNVAWALPLPALSGATPIIWGDHIFLQVGHDPEQNKSLALWAVDRKNGEVLWQRKLGDGNEVRYKHNMSSPSPVTDGEHVWVITGTGVLKAFDFDGKEIWSRDLQADYGAFGLMFGYASSPLLHGDSLYVQVLHGSNTDDPSYLLRLDKASGETHWRIERPTDALQESPDAYTTPMLLERGSDGRVRLELVISGGDVITGHDLDSGKELWRVPGINPSNNPAGRVVASPLVHGQRIYAFGKRGPVVAFDAGSNATPELVWQLEKGTDVPTPVTDGKYVYMITDKGFAYCLDAATGEALYGPERLPTGAYSASPVLADGRVYVINETGVTTVLQAGPEFKVLATNEFENSDLAGYTLSSPAIAGGQIFLRTSVALIAVGTGTEGEAPNKPAAEASTEAEG